MASRKTLYNITSAIRRKGIVLRDRKDRAELLEIVAETVAQAARRKAVAKGGRRFWVRDIRDSVHAEQEGNGWTVGSTHAAAAHKQYGGAITAPGRGPAALQRRFLTIPVGDARKERWNTIDAQAAGWRIFRIGKVSGNSGGYLIGAKGKGKTRRTQLLFVLKKTVTQAADPWFPEGTELEAAVEKGIRIWRATQE